MFSSLSKELTKKLSVVEKKNNGIYFSPPSSINKMISTIDFTNIKTVLEPSCGSCEIVNIIDNYTDCINIDCIEYNKTIYDSIKDLQFKNKVNIINDDFIKHKFNKKYDLIVENPPYYVLKKNQVDKKYCKYFEGRPNMFILFIIKSLSLLNDNGYASFILPASFLNCLYYDKTRKYINDNFKIVDIINCGDDSYLETQQETIIITLQKTKPKNKKFIIELSDYTIFNTKNDIKELTKLLKDSKTLDTLGFNVSVGNVVWNQVKDILTHDNSKTILVYSSDIKNNKFEMVKYSNEQKKNYINKEGLKYPTLVINRGYGNGKYNFNYALLDIDKEYLIENHLIVIKPVKEVNKKELIETYNKIIKSFNNEKTTKFIDMYLKNNALNTVELQYILPIYL